VDAQVPGEREQVVGEADHLGRHVVEVGLGNRAPAVDLLAPGVLLTG
jgi:hypothetical protein